MYNPIPKRLPIPDFAAIEIVLETTDLKHTEEIKLILIAYYLQLNIPRAKREVKKRLVHQFSRANRETSKKEAYNGV